MSSVDVNALSRRAGEVAKTHHLPMPKARAFMITLSNPRHVDLLLQQITFEDPFVMKDMNSGIIGGFTHSSETLQHLLHKVDAYKEAFDSELMSVLTGSDWLDTYLSMRNFCIDHASECHHATTEKALKNEMSDTLEHRTRRLNYQRQLKRNHEICLSSSFGDVVDDISDFLIHNCEGYKSENTVRKTVASIIKKLEIESADFFFANRHYTLDITTALENYTEAHQEDSRPEGALNARFAVRDIADQAEDDKRSFFDKGQPASLNLLKKGLPKLTMKGLRELFEDPDADVQLTKPFSGLELSGIGSGTFKERMDPGYVRYRIQEQGDDFHEWVANTITSYVYTFIQYRHEEAYRNALIDFSKTDDAKDYPDYAMKLFQDSRTRLYQGESLEAGSPSNHQSDIGF